VSSHFQLKRTKKFKPKTQVQKVTLETPVVSFLIFFTIYDHRKNKLKKTNELEFLFFFNFFFFDFLSRANRKKT